ncbi:MAG: hypothetical protein KC931_21030, partial [Candidatus Omnitrophica bacterium]|nr:hypothetical protein [Candidatus Omnitrophota bacterium]
ASRWIGVFANFLHPPVQFEQAAEITEIEVLTFGGDDRIVIHNSITLPSTVDGGADDDRIYGGRGVNHLLGGSGNDLLLGGDGDDFLEGGEGDDLISGGDGNDLIYAGAGNDVIDGGKGDDILYGEDGQDWLFGDKGNDILLGGDGQDWLDGGKDRDILIGGNQGDALFGDKDDDILIGGFTAYDNDLNALNLIREEWTSHRSYTNRVENLRTGSGPILNSSVYLKTRETVQDDHAVDYLFGEKGRDWLFASLDDCLRDRERNEVVEE